jgi:enamine deaminase RidA (YjgF/YER057c/UK114 family)
MTRQIIQTSRAPAAIGTYSQAVKVGPTVYISGQIPLDPATGELKTFKSALPSPFTKIFPPTQNRPSTGPR